MYLSPYLFVFVPRKKISQVTRRAAPRRRTHSLRFGLGKAQLIELRGPPCLRDLRALHRFVLRVALLPSNSAQNNAVTNKRPLTNLGSPEAVLDSIFNTPLSHLGCLPSLPWIAGSQGREQKRTGGATFTSAASHELHLD